MSEAIVFDDILCDVFVSLHMRVNSRSTTLSVIAPGILPLAQTSESKNTASLKNSIKTISCINFN